VLYTAGVLQQQCLVVTAAVLPLPPCALNPSLEAAQGVPPAVNAAAGPEMAHPAELHLLPVAHQAATSAQCWALHWLCTTLVLLVMLDVRQHLDEAHLAFGQQIGLATALA